VCDRFLADPGLVGAAAPAVSAVADEARGDALRWHEAWYHGEIAADDGMGVKLFTQDSLRSYRAREDDESARLLIKPMDDPQTLQRTFADAPFAPRDEFYHEIIKRRRERTAAFVPFALCWMTDSGNSAGLLDNDEMLVEMADDNSFLMARLSNGTGEHFDGLAFLEAPCRIEAQLTVDASASGGDQPSDLVPGLSRQPLAKQGGESPAGLFDGENKRIKGFVHRALFEII
jgi:hypothetical protein